jgi:hypothetical protein
VLTISEQRKEDEYRRLRKVGMLGQIDSIKPRTLSVLWGELK